MLLVGLSVGWKVLVLTLGVAVPRWVIGDGLDLLPAGARGLGEQAKVTAMSLWDHPIERFGLVQALRVMYVDSTTHSDANARASERERAHVPVRSDTAIKCEGGIAIVRAYTYFAIPYSQARTVCGTGVVEYRVFRRHQ